MDKPLRFAMGSWLRAIVPLAERSSGTPRLLLAVVGCLSIVLAAACAPETARPPPPEQAAPAEAKSPAEPEPAVAAAEPTPTRGPSPAAEVGSDDGSGRLHLPDGALPAGVSSDEVSITRVDGADLPFTLEAEGFGGLLAYRLEPSGLQLLEPATIEIAFETDSDLSPFLLHVSDDEVALLEEVAIGVNSATGQASIVGQLSHFSWVVYYQEPSEDNPLRASLAAPSPNRVGETFPVVGQVTWEPVRGQEHLFRVLRDDGEWVYTYVGFEYDLWGFHGGGVLSPNFIPSDGIWRPFTGNARRDVEFTCVSEGTGHIILTGTLRGSGALIRAAGLETRQVEHPWRFNLQVSGPVECEDRPPDPLGFVPSPVDLVDERLTVRGLVERWVETGMDENVAEVLAESWLRGPAEPPGGVPEERLGPVTREEFREEESERETPDIEADPPPPIAEPHELAPPDDPPAVELVPFTVLVLDELAPPDDPPAVELVPFTVLVLDGEHYPAEQFFSGAHPDVCAPQHWHARGPVRSFEGTVTEDPDPFGCGFGYVSDIPPIVHEVPPDVFREYQEWRAEQERGS